MKKNESIEKVLSREIVTIHTGQKVSDVRKVLSENGFHHLPVVSGKKLIGLITASDILGISVEGVGSDERSMDAYLDHQFSIDRRRHEEGPQDAVAEIDGGGCCGGPFRWCLPCGPRGGRWRRPGGPRDVDRPDSLSALALLGPGSLSLVSGSTQDRVCDFSLEDSLAPGP